MDNILEINEKANEEINYMYDHLWWNNELKVNSNTSSHSFLVHFHILDLSINHHRSTWSLNVIIYKPYWADYKPVFTQIFFFFYSNTKSSLQKNKKVDLNCVFHNKADAKDNTATSVVWLMVVVLSFHLSPVFPDVCGAMPCFHSGFGLCFRTVTALMLVPEFN